MKDGCRGAFVCPFTITRVPHGDLSPLFRCVDIGAELFAISSTVVYADTVGREQPERKLRKRVSVGD